MSTTRLSALDASFLAVESAASPMHVGWVATFDGPGPGFAVLRDHLTERLEGMPRYRQKLAPVPLELHDPVWADDPRFDPAEHLGRMGAHDELAAWECLAERGEQATLPSGVEVQVNLVNEDHALALERLGPGWVGDREAASNVRDEENGVLLSFGELVDAKGLAIFFKDERGLLLLA